MDENHDDQAGNQTNSINKKNYYQILEIPSRSTREEIHYGYLRAKNAYSPDNPAIYSIMPIEECNEMLDQIEEAYFILSSPNKRKEYDLARGFNKGDSFQDFHYGSERTSPDLNSDRYYDRRGEPSPSIQSKITSVENDQIANAPAKQNIAKIIIEKRFNLDYDINPELEKEIESNPIFSGEFLQKVREYKNVSIERMADLTKVSKTYLRNLEEENYDNLPATVYLRGFVFQYAKTLRLTPDIVAASYMERVKEHRSQI